LPGCPIQGDCASLAASAWGRWGGWPVSFLGLAFFLALTIGWGLAGPALPWPWKWLARTGIMISAILTGVMLYSQEFCSYCLATHVANAVFWICLELSPSGDTPRSWLGLSSTGTAFCMVTLILGISEYARAKYFAAEDAANLAESARQVITSSYNGHRNGAESAVSAVGPEGLTGRFRRGPEEASLRVVAWLDFECELCRSMEQALVTIVAQVPSMSLTVRHFPNCADCNRLVHDQRHAFACRAAQAAEAAGRIGGSEAFWKMSNWLIEKKGLADDTLLRDALPSLGISDAERFFQEMNSADVKQIVHDDVELAIQLGIESTPFIFLNGVELRGLRKTEQLTKLVNELIAEKLPPKTAAADRPRPGMAKFFELWQDGKTQPLDEKMARWELGRPEGKIRVILTGGTDAPQSQDADRILQDLIERHPEIHVSFFHFPLTGEQNPHLKQDSNAYPSEYVMALATEAAGQVGGNEAFWKMRKFLSEHRDGPPSARISEACRNLDFVPETLSRSMQDPATVARVAADMDAVAAAGITWAPHLIINGRLVHGWTVNPEILTSIVESVAGAR
jgi:predicted DsbA family dithiol-disulfide isomerase